MSTWARSGRRPAARGGRPLGSWGLAMERARASWDELRPSFERGGPYSEFAADAILRLAVALWADTAASVGGPADDWAEDDLGSGKGPG